MNNIEWISQSYKIDSKKGLIISNVDLFEIANDVKGSFYIYDYNTIENSFNSLKTNLDKCGINIYYSVKANTNLAVVKSLYDLGAGLEVASLGEILAAKKINAEASRISFAGPSKTEEELKLAIDYGISTINVENIQELSRINLIAKSLNKVQRIGIRVNSINEIEDAGGLMSGGSKKFGFDEEIVTKQFINKLSIYKNISIEGLHVFAATQMLSAKTLVDNIDYICSIAENLNKLFNIKYIDFGGGLGIPYSINQNHLDLNKISKSINLVLKKYKFLKENNTQLYVEPGRFLVGLSGIYITRVNNVKVSRGKNIVITEGGINHIMRPALSVGSNGHPVYNLTKLNLENTATYDIGGPLCTSLDFIGKQVNLPLTEVGDIIGIFNAGAYGWSEAMPFFLSHSTAAEIMVKNSSYKIVRESIESSEFFNGQHIF